MFDVTVIALIILFAFKYLNAVGKLSVYIFCAVALVFNSVSRYIPDEHGEYYYLLAGLIDLLIIYSLSRIKNPTKTTIIIQSWCAIFIITNFIGWVIYMLYYPSTAYDYLCSITYVLMLLTIIKGQKDGNINMDWNRPSLFRYIYGSTIAMSRNSTTTRL